MFDQHVHQFLGVQVMIVLTVPVLCPPTKGKEIAR